MDSTEFVLQISLGLTRGEWIGEGTKLDSIEGGVLTGLNFGKMKFPVKNGLSLSSMHEFPKVENIEYFHQRWHHETQGIVLLEGGNICILLGR